ncbi:SdrD B-like domain-containing protein [Sporolactobacillus nakayamae]|uniref:LPXTG-motif cell wall anchor domain-containing protein n=1 Tax=Sporolactobacillus nakayamae TaxID=269670 RepID=A0A1I2V857_9BACL|nr:SdrD B-like domain-containing protein [Sporolactobacillus nakayamae]SFG85203.1 LPXTG-motif cell wall anchor domain-containing protein [Sporolactobacillus nakayamae]
MRAKRLPLGLKKTKHNRLVKRLMIIALSFFVVFSQMSLSPFMGKAEALESGSQINDATVTLTNFKVDDKDMSNSSTNANVDPNSSVELDYDWSIPDGAVNSGDYFTFSIPSQIDVPNGFTEQVNLNGTPIGTPIGTLTVGTDNKATITLNDYFQKNPSYINRKGTATINVSFAQSVKTGTVVQQIDFGNGKNYTLAFKTSQNDVTKSGVTDTHTNSTPDFNASTITWTSYINTHADTVDNATVTDTPTLPTGVGDPTNMHIYPVTMNLDGSEASKGAELTSPSDYTVSPVNSSTHVFTISFTNPITQAYKIVYDTTINQDKKINSGSPSSSVNPSFTNNIQLNGTVDGNSLTDAKNSASVTAHYAPFMTKSSNGSYDSSTQTITWTINYNFNNSLVNSPVIHDIVTGDSGYVDGSLTVKKVTPTGSSSYKNPISDTGTVNSISSDRKTFDITLNGGSQTSDAYVITYKTQASDSEHIEQGEVSNAATSNGATVNTDPVKVYNVGITKSGTIDPKSNTINWTIDLNQLHQTLNATSDKNGPTLTDTFGSGIYGFDQSSLTIIDKNNSNNKLTEGTDYAVTPSNDGNSGFTIDFHHPLDSTIEYLLSYSTNYNPQSGYSNNYKLDYNDGTVDKKETGSGSVGASSAESTNGYKTGSYDASTKTFTWDEVVNFDSLTMEKAEVTDTMNQDPDKNGSHNIMVTNPETGKPIVTVYKFNYDSGDPHAKKLLTPLKGEVVNPSDYTVTPTTTEAGITGFTLTFNNEIKEPYVIEYQSQPTGVIYKSGNYKNDVTLKDLDNSSVTYSFNKTVTVPHAADYTVKNGQMLGAPYDTVEWNVAINEAQSDLGKNVKLTDSLSANQTYDHDSFKLYKAVVDPSTGNLTKGDLVPLTGYSISFSQSANNGENFELDFPANQEITGAYILTYNQNIVRSKGLTQIINNAQIAGAGYTSTSFSEPVNVRIATGGATGSGEDVGYVSVGNYVWFDKNRDGIQESNEEGIPGIVLSIKRSDNKDIIMPDGSQPTEQTTDSTGHYEFSNLPALPDGQHYIVSIDNDAQSTKNALNGKVPTLKEQGNDTSKDSSTNSAESKDLKNDGDSDQTLDFGFKVPSVSVGDYVWLDKNRDGIQNSEDGDNSGINGVKLNLIVVDKDGKTVDSSVKNINGETVGSQITSTHDGKAGYYNFTDLPLLPDGEFYQVSIDKNDDGTLTALDNLVPTEPQKTATDKDSSDWTANAVTLNEDGESDPTLDFGFVEKSVSVGDYVWKDINRDGIQQDGEKGINGVRLNVSVVDADGQVIKSTVTDVFGNEVLIQTTKKNETTGKDGYYLFPDLPALPSDQRYQVTIDQDQSALALTNLIPTLAGQGDNNENDSSTWTETAKALTENGDEDQSLDFGFVEKSVSVGDYVWKDVNRDGIQQNGESGINDVQVHLTLVDADGEHPVTDVFGDSVQHQKTVTKDGNKGYYQFDNLPALLPGQLYRVTVDLDQPADALNNLIPTLAGRGDKTQDSSSNFADSILLPNDKDNDPTLDFGYIEKSVSVGNYVWKDMNRDGIQQDGEKGINGVQLSVSVVDADGQVIKSTVTDVFGNEVLIQTTKKNETTGKDGYYLFPDLPALPSDQRYQVTIDQDQSASALTNLIPTLAGQGDNNENDSSTWTETAKALTENGDKDQSLDFGFVEKSVSVGDYVWKDINRDGIQQDNEQGINGVQVRLTMVDQYGEHPVKDVYGDDVNPKTTTDDKNGNKGYYKFTNLPALLPGQLYRVTIDTDAESSKSALANLITTLAGQGSDLAKDSSTGFVNSVFLPNNNNDDPTLDFGYIEKSVSVGDYVWKDVNRNGKQDDGNTGINNVTVRITGPDGQSVTDVYGDPVGERRTETKDGKTGHYEFDNLPALPSGKHYTVSIVTDDTTKEALTNLIPTQTGEGTRAEDSSTGNAESTDLINDGDSDPTLDFGYIENSVSVGDYIWLDKNKNGIQDNNESGIESVVVNVIGPNGKPVIDVFGNEVKATKTDSKGHYEFGNLPALPEGKHYTVTIDQNASKDALNNLIPTKEKAGEDSAKDSSTWKAESSDLTKNGDKDPTLDFGFIQKSVSVGDYVWLDKNKDGIQNDNEKGIEGVTVTIKGPNGQTVKDNDGKEITSTKTDKDGHYGFTNLPSLPAGEHYKVSIDKDTSKQALINLAPTKENGSSDKGKDSSTWRSESGNLFNDGDKDLSLDFGFIEKSVSVGDYIWLDKNKNGVQDKGESGIPGVVIVITGPDGKPVTDLNGNEVNQVKTDSEGHYEFSNLPSLPEGQHYTVSIDRDASKGALKGLIPAKENGTNDKSKDSSTWKAESGNLLNDGDQDLTLDFGFVEETVPLVLKGGEPGAIYNVVDENGHVIVRGVMADEEGNVNFKGLATGKYHLVLVRGVEAETQTTKKPKVKGTKGLPITGDTNDMMTMAVGAILLIGGGFLTIFSRRRRKN